MKEAFFTDKQKVDSLRQWLEEAAKVLTENHRKIKAFSEDMTPYVTILTSFYRPDIPEVSSTIGKQIEEEILRILTEKAKALGLPLLLDSSAKNMAIDLINKCHFNNYIYVPQTRSYEPKSERKGLGGCYVRSEKDITPIVSWVTLSDCVIYLSFDGSKFYINEEAFKKYVESQTLYATNKKQLELVRKAELVSKTIGEMEEIVGKPLPGHYSHYVNYPLLKALIGDIK